MAPLTEEVTTTRLWMELQDNVLCEGSKQQIVLVLIGLFSSLSLSIFFIKGMRVNIQKNR